MRRIYKLANIGIAKKDEYLDILQKSLLLQGASEITITKTKSGSIDKIIGFSLKGKKLSTYDCYLNHKNHYWCSKPVYVEGREKAIKIGKETFASDYELTSQILLADYENGDVMLTAKAAWKRWNIHQRAVLDYARTTNVKIVFVGEEV